MQQYWHNCYLKHTLLDAIVVGCIIFLSSTVVLTPNGQFLDCANIAFNE